MILFTGGGAIANEFCKYFDCKIISIRNMNNDEIESWISKAHTIIHNSALINSTNLHELLSCNFILTKNIVDLCYKINPSIKFINISSMSILNQYENYNSLSLMSSYALSKYFAEVYCINHPLINSISVRFSTIFYNNQEKDGISKLIFDSKKGNEILIYNDGSAKRDIIPIRIAVEYLSKLCHTNFEKKIINIVSGSETSFKDISLILKNNNPLLKIKSEKCTTNDVPSTFSINDITKLGRINFNLESEIVKYFNSIS
jgi:nucleoside-diphosphate-sugar epimerase